MKNVKYSICVFLGGALWGIVSLFVTPMSQGGLTSMQISLIRMAMAAITVCIFCLIRDRSAFRIKMRDLPILLLNGLLSGVLFNFFYFTTIINSQASVAAMLNYTAPIFVMILSRLIFKEKMTGRKYLILAMTVIGCACVAGFIGHASAIPLIALFSGLATGATYGSYTIVTRLNTQNYSVMTVCLYTFIFGTIMMLPLGHPVECLRILGDNHSLIPYALIFGPLCSSLANGLFTSGIAGISANRASILAASEPLTGAIVGMTVWGEPHDAVKLFGIFLVLSAIVLQGLDKKKEEE